MRTYLKKHLSKLKYLLYIHRLFQDKTIVVIVSTMRSGSTLLKALLANSPDTTHLLEVNFEKLKKSDYWRLKVKYKQKIIVIKKPCFLTEVDYYPALPNFKNIKIVVLIRNPYDTISSLKEMARVNNTNPGIESEEYVNDYWCKVYENILANKILDQPNSILVKYNELVQNPIGLTKELFKFIGSKQTNGVDTYTYPEAGIWKWGSDDGGEVIKELKVIENKKIKDDLQLINIIESSKRVKEIKSKYDLTL
jgi:hypothetical protein